MSCSAAARRWRVFSTTSAGALAVNPALASLARACPASFAAAARSFSIRRRSAATSITPAVSSSTVTPSASIAADGVNPASGGLSRSRKRMRSS